MLPLSGVKVLDLSRVLAGPYCCSLLGEMGAEVIKVERPGVGDENRKWGKLWHGRSLDFMNVNRNKRGITINLSQAEGQEIVRRLAAGSDVLVESFIPGTLEKYGLGYETLGPLNPRLVYCSISAFGDRGPLRQKPGYDGSIQAFSGLMDMTGEADGGPVRSGASVVDMGTGIAAYGAVVTALMARHATGKGQKVTASLLQTALAFLGSHAASSRMTGYRPARAGAGVSHVVPYGAFTTRDSHVVTGALNQQSWRRLCQVLGCEELCADPRFREIGDRVANRKALDAILNGVFARRTTEEWVALFDEAGLVISPVNTLEQVLAHPQVDANGMMVGVDHACGPLDLVGAPMSFAQWDSRPRSAPPDLGEHTDEILASIGYAAADIESLKAGGVV